MLLERSCRSAYTSCSLHSQGGTLGLDLLAWRGKSDGVGLPEALTAATSPGRKAGSHWSTRPTPIFCPLCDSKLCTATRPRAARPSLPFLFFPQAPSPSTLRFYATNRADCAPARSLGVSLARVVPQRLPETDMRHLLPHMRNSE